MSYILSPSGDPLAFLAEQAEAPWKETLRWVTDIMPGRTGTEQRLQLRTVPQRSFAAQMSVPHTRTQDAFNTIWGALALAWAAPLWHDAQYIGDLAAGTDTLTVDTAHADWYAGGQVLLWAPSGTWTYATVQTVGSGSLTLTAPTEVAIAGCSVVPIRPARLTGTPQMRTTGFGAAWSLTYELTENAAHNGAAPDQFLGEDVDWGEVLFDSGGLNITMTPQLDRVDYDVGNAVVTTPWTYNRTARLLQRIAETPAEAWAMRQWLHRRAGKYRAFWQPSWEADLLLTSTGALGSTIQVRDSSRFAWAQKRTHLAVLTRSGTWLPRTVETITQVSDGIVELGLSSSLAINAAEVDRISNLGLRRLDTDSVDLNWVGNGVATMSAMTVEIQP